MGVIKQIAEYLYLRKPDPSRPKSQWIKYISLVNLIMDKKIVTELIQDELTTANLVKELEKILHDPKTISRMKEDYSELKNLLQEKSSASARSAQEIVGFLQSNA